jgi:FKBP-type peptidyl-prolyl cis-trans isomerase FklB
MMKKLGLILAGSMVLVACNNPEQPKLDDDTKKASYAIGYRTGEQMQGLMQDMDLEAFLAGMRHGTQGDSAEPMLSDEELDQAIQDYQEQQRAAAEAKAKKAAEDNVAEGEKFREENAAKDGVTTTESGLQYEVLVSGEDGAAQPTLEDTVVVDYHGTLPDGTVFDSSVERGQPATFPLGGIIKGWQEALTMMKVGDKWRIVLPPELAYGERGAGAVIGPNQTLIFEVELLDIEGDDAE